MDKELFGSDRMWGLKELPLPESVSWFPAAPGWLAVALVGIAVLVWGFWRIRRAWLRDAYRRDALARLDEISSGRSSIDRLPELLRATALAAFARDEVAALRGRAWVEWLNRNGGRFDAADGSWLDRLPYDTDALREIDASTSARLVTASRKWVKAHRALV